MAINNYGALKAVIADFLQRDNLSVSIPLFVELATARFSDELRTPEMEAIYTTTVTAEYTALPSDFRAVRLVMGNDKPIEFVTPFVMQRLAQNKANPSVPLYTIQDMQLRIYPLQSSMAVYMTYYGALTTLVNDVDTNWLLTKRPDVYLQAAIAQARLYLHDDERVMAAQAMTDKYIAEANRAARHIAIGASPLTIRVA